VQHVGFASLDEQALLGFDLVFGLIPLICHQVMQVETDPKAIWPEENGQEAIWPMVIWPVVILPVVILPVVRLWEMQLEMLNEVFLQILVIAMLQIQVNRLAV